MIKLILIAILAIGFGGCTGDNTKITDGNATSESLTPIDNGDVIVIEGENTVDYVNGSTVVDCGGTCGDITITVQKRENIGD